MIETFPWRIISPLPNLILEVSDPLNRVVKKTLPFLTPDEAEFLISGITPEEWEEMYGEEK